MRWIEIINVRIAATTDPSAVENLFRDIGDHLAARDGEEARVIIYRGHFVDSDWAIHIHWETGKKPPGRTGLGIELANAVRPMALVDHSVLIETDRTVRGQVFIVDKLA